MPGVKQRPLSGGVATVNYDALLHDHNRRANGGAEIIDKVDPLAKIDVPGTPLFVSRKAG